MTTTAINAAAAGTWTLGDLTVNRVGFGAIRHLGLSNVRPEQDEFVRACGEQGVAFVPFFALAGAGGAAGFGGGEHEDVVAAGGLRLSPDDLARLDAAHRGDRR
ncbi:hypothetical protein [Micromonospora sp. WMMD882]|uniref:hypothetical protein n=1 Tax=Micromonospora sp. WMMD882 TaxID=3015151 RepID=UPI0032B2E6B6